MSDDSKDHSFVAFTSLSVDDTIPNTIFVAAIIDPTMHLNLPPVTDLDLGCPLGAVNRPPEQQPAIVYLSSLSVSSRRPQAVALSTIAAILTAGAPGARCAALQLPWHHLRFVHTNAVRATLAERYAPATRVPSGRRYLAALRGVLKACWRGPSGRDLIDQQTLAKTLNFKPIPGESEEAAAGRSLSFREMTTLMQHLAGQGVNGLRDAALIAVAYAAP